MSFNERLQKVSALAEALGKNRNRIVDLAVKDLSFMVRDSQMEVGLAMYRLRMFKEAKNLFLAWCFRDKTGWRLRLFGLDLGDSWWRLPHKTGGKTPQHRDIRALIIRKEIRKK